MTKVLNFPGNNIHTGVDVVSAQETAEGVISLLNENLKDIQEIIVLFTNRDNDLCIFSGTNVDGPKALWLLEHAKMELMGV